MFDIDKYIQNQIEFDKIYRQQLSPFSREETRKLGRFILFFSILSILISYNQIGIQEIESSGVKVVLTNKGILPLLITIISGYLVIVYSIEIVIDWKARKRLDDFDKVTKELSEMNQNIISQTLNATNDVLSFIEHNKDKNLMESEELNERRSKVEELIKYEKFLVNNNREFVSKFREINLFHKIRFIVEVIATISFSIFSITLAQSNNFQIYVKQFFP